MDVTNAGRGDKDIVLTDKNNDVMVAFENGGKQHVSVSTNGGVQPSPHSKSASATVG